VESHMVGFEKVCPATPLNESPTSTVLQVFCRV